jgi:hypothetical protein
MTVENVSTTLLDDSFGNIGTHRFKGAWMGSSDRFRYSGAEISKRIVERTVHRVPEQGWPRLCKLTMSWPKGWTATSLFEDSAWRTTKG